MGLTHPADLAAWERWQRRRQPLTRRLRGFVTDLRGRTGSDTAVLTRSGPGPRVLIVLDAVTPTAVGALLRPLEHLPGGEVAILSASPLGVLAPEGWESATGPVDDLLAAAVAPGGTVVALGHYLGLGNAAHGAAMARSARFVTVQHGLMTPHAPPLAPDTTLLAWSEADAAFWRSGRTDVTTRVVGSQLLWDAGARTSPRTVADAAPVFLGQLHGAELPRQVLVDAAEGFCRATGATYRPHPAEVDRRSRAIHRRWEREGIEVDRRPVPLHALGRPVVGVFSTGILEAAAAGLPAWVYLPDPPAWVREFWTRYGLRTWGDSPTPSPERPSVEPSRAAASVIREMMEG